MTSAAVTMDVCIDDEDVVVDATVNAEHAVLEIRNARETAQREQ